MISELAEKIKVKEETIQNWLEDRSKSMAAVPPVYGSVDLRNAGFKIAPVDTNLFPAGFNNLCETFSDNASLAFQNYFRKSYPHIQKILMIPEEHTRNLFYWKNIAALSFMLRKAGLEVQIASASTVFQDLHTIDIEEGESIQIQKLLMKDGYLQTARFVPDAILLNNDLSSGIPDYLKGVHQPILPSPQLGWHQRRKSDHFFYYEQLIQELASLLDSDPWYFSPMTTVETGIDLADEICLKRLQESAEALLSRIRQKYLQYGIQREPYLFIKNNSGTYGLGLTHIQSSKELLEINRRLRNKLEYAKGGQGVSEYLLQEGIPTADLYRAKPLEPVVYCVGGEPIGTFFRIHEEKTELDSLNAPGMQFGCVCYHKIQKRKTYELTYENKEKLFTVASLLCRVTMMAAMQEMEKVNQISKTESA
ncbi:MAG: glutamate--cysteine ligase [Deltaproteobacteria bacterium]|nr:glutamate--cysteine ligase [Deltaproteobacteria bacterium]